MKIYLSKKIGKACFQHDKAYYDFKGFPRRMGSDKIAFNILNKPKYDGYQCGLVSLFCNFFDKKSKRWQ